MAWNEPGGGNNSNDQDPWGSGGNRGGNRGGKQGPPDLDEALRKLQDSLNNLFGSGKRSGNGGSDRGNGSGAGVPGWIWGLALVVVLGFWAFKAVYMVNEQEQAVILRFGEYHRTVGPGLHLYFPPVESKFQRNVTQVRSYRQKGQMLTEDENIVEVPVAIQYRISNLENFVLKVEDPETSLRHATESAVRHVVGSTPMHQVLTEGREQMAVEVTERLQRYLDAYNTGITVTQVNIENAQAPAEVQDAFDDVIRAKEDEVRARNQAEAYANGVIPEARGRAQRMLEEASGYHDEVIARAEGEAQRFDLLLEQYQAAPGVLRERLYLDAMQDVLSNTSKVLIAGGEGSNNLLYLPLDKMIGQGGSTSSATGASSLPSMSQGDASTRSTTSQQRDLRSRESR
ncbi:MAG: FtsH protease activity modulator HflK [Pseudomonadales bacterium]|jgi:membrane protease subunit HflK|uniref:FtsH protease activity modulator HflK n=1 Tax=Halopseudomonas TaxID=2901189 RepID=UPI000C52B258|nr:MULTISPECIES: FtsH protease activity modulator HflK [Halopseudomonas]MAD27228.1 FtsH protease activity modulator HflK [Pseudomonadales bacterium]MEE2800233.1 FtsH protease activity modulator HflK [Pseudomonadota bacterium]HBT58184.1 FtsH protease activity modulator HflK [Pseudomonas sp.]MAK73347.1 FtsH protease activity modulator HflK [Pseudomonadales bacterium]MAS66230.1 FtsH protease activity modulator HflK [Pseudomonadales bacterium]|tara:strand:+ start:30840 stop:32039 length:1200 start_codon:yes stop_codon:yes gene_type:complete